MFKLSAFDDPSLVQFIHRNLAYVISIFYLLILFKIYRNRIYDLYRSVNILGIIIVVQVFLGIYTILNGAQIVIASMHQISSIFLVSSSIYLLYKNLKTN